MGNVPAEISAYFSKIAKDGAQNLSPEARHLRAQVAAEARWARVRAQARIDSAAEQIRRQHLAGTFCVVTRDRIRVRRMGQDRPPGDQGTSAI